jgi:hypothetical protein
MEAVKKFAVILFIGFFAFYLLGSISKIQSKPRENPAPYVNYYHNK